MELAQKLRKLDVFKILPEKKSNFKVWMGQFSPELDFPTETVPTRKYVVTSTPRSGSHFLGHLLYSTGAAGYPIEYFNKRNVPHWKERFPGPHYFRDVQKKRTSANGVFGMKLHSEQLSPFREYCADDPQECLSDYKFIFLTRKDKVAQAVSYSRALQTGSFISDVSEKQAFDYDETQIEQCLGEIMYGEMAWRKFLSIVLGRTIEIVFENLRNDPEITMNQIFEFLGISHGAADLDISFVKQRQSDALNGQYRDRFIEAQQQELC